MVKGLAKRAGSERSKASWSTIWCEKDEVNTLHTPSSAFTCIWPAATAFPINHRARGTLIDILAMLEVRVAYLAVAHPLGPLLDASDDQVQWNE